MATNQETGGSSPSRHAIDSRALARLFFCVLMDFRRSGLRVGTRRLRPVRYAAHASTPIRGAAVKTRGSQIASLRPADRPNARRLRPVRHAHSRRTSAGKTQGSQSASCLRWMDKARGCCAMCVIKLGRLLASLRPMDGPTARWLRHVPHAHLRPNFGCQDAWESERPLPPVDGQSAWLLCHASHTHPRRASPLPRRPH